MGSTQNCRRNFGKVRIGRQTTKGDSMSWLLILVFIILVIIVFGLGFVVKALLWVALALFILWIIYVLISLLRRGR